MAHDRKAQYKAYNIASQNLPKTRQIVLLYDGAINALRQVREAMNAKNVEMRYKRSLRATEIITGLQGSLDFENGGEVAQVLYDFYTSVNLKIMSLNHGAPAEVCDEIIRELKDMRDAWHAIDAQQGGETAQGNADMGGSAATAGGASPPTPSITQISV